MGIKPRKKPQPLLVHTGEVRTVAGTKVRVMRASMTGALWGYPESDDRPRLDNLMFLEGPK